MNLESLAKPPRWIGFAFLAVVLFAIIGVGGILLGWSYLWLAPFWAVSLAVIIRIAVGIAALAWTDFR